MIVRQVGWLVRVGDGEVLEAALGAVVHVETHAAASIGAAGADPAVVMEFKVFYDWDEEALADTVERGIAPERILTYGIAFRGKEVLVG